MTQTAQPLYPKISSIYNKIMQLAIAIVFIVILMNIWLENVHKDRTSLNQHFNKVSDQYIGQIRSALEVLMVKGDKKSLEAYVKELAEHQVLDSVYLYDESGQLLVESGNASTVKALYGVAPNTLNESGVLVPFVTEIRTEEVIGFVRINMLKSEVVAVLEKQNKDKQQLVRFMLILAGIAGFFLTRGLSRFSRQGFRVAPAN